MEALSRREETDVMDSARTIAMKECDTYVRECAAGRTFTLPFACRSNFQAMNRCMKEYLTEEKLDAMKLEYIANRSEKGRLAVEQLRDSRTSHLKKMYKRKGEESADTTTAPLPS